MKLVDSHCHLDDERFAEDRQAVIDRALEAGVTRMMAIGTGGGPPDIEAAVRLADLYSCFYATVGVHPHDAAKASPATFDNMRKLAAHPKVLAVGEIGLDYHYDFSPREAQREVFVEQVRLAREVRKPIVIHTREAWEDTIGVLEIEWNKEDTDGGIMHCFTGGPDQARQALELGFHLSFGGIITFTKAEDVREAARLTPEDRLLVETDAPYLAPVPHRGKRNEPAFLVHTIGKLAEIRGTTTEALAELTARNFGQLCLRAESANE